MLINSTFELTKQCNMLPYHYCKINKILLIRSFCLKSEKSTSCILVTWDIMKYFCLKRVRKFKGPRKSVILDRRPIYPGYYLSGVMSNHFSLDLVKVRLF